jgi:hypothetical protein
MSKTVKFSGESRPPRHDRGNNSDGSSASNGHRRSDSGVGSFSDQASYGENPDRAFTASDQRYDIHSWKAAHDSVCDQRDRLQNKVNKLHAELTFERKSNREIDASRQALCDRNETLEDEKKGLLDLIASLRKDLEKAQRKIEKLSGPTMAGALHYDTEPERRVQRSDSKRDAERKAQKEKEKLAKRFERSSDEGDVQSDTIKAIHSRRRSYVEPYGPPAPKVTVSQPTGRQYSNFTNDSPFNTAYSSIQDSAHPSVTYVYEQSPFQPNPYEDGNYHAHPLPNEMAKSR